MAYATQTDLLQRMSLAELTQLTDDTGAGAPDEAIISGELEEASGKVDGYCRNKYVTPLQPSDQVTAITRDIAVYLLFSRRPQKMREVVRQRFEDAIALLKDIATGKAVLDQPAGDTAQAINAGAVLPTRKHERFNERNLEGFI
jgi:phage gp36-like protein